MAHIGAVQNIACTDFVRFVVKLNKRSRPLEDLVQILNCFEGVGIYWVQRTQAADIDDGLDGGRMCVGHAILQPINL